MTTNPGHEAVSSAESGKGRAAAVLCGDGRGSGGENVLYSERPTGREEPFSPTFTRAELLCSPAEIFDFCGRFCGEGAAAKRPTPEPEKGGNYI